VRMSMCVRVCVRERGGEKVRETMRESKRERGKKRVLQSPPPLSKRHFPLFMYSSFSFTTTLTISSPLSLLSLSPALSHFLDIKHTFSLSLSLSLSLCRHPFHSSDLPLLFDFVCSVAIRVGLSDRKLKGFEIGPEQARSFFNHPLQRL